LRKKHQDLLVLRRTQPEGLLAETQANASKKTEAAEKLIAKLKEENKKLTEGKAAERTKGDNNKKSEELQAQVTPQHHFFFFLFSGCQRTSRSHHHHHHQIVFRSQA